MKKIILMIDTNMDDVLAKCDATGMCNATDYEKCIEKCTSHANYPMEKDEIIDIAQYVKAHGSAYADGDYVMFMLVDLDDVLKV